MSACSTRSPNPTRCSCSWIDRLLSGLPADTPTLPSHGKPFRGLHTRIRQLHEHHRDRLAEVLAASPGPALLGRGHPAHSVQAAARAHQTTFAMGEAVAHLHALWFKKQLQRRLGADGVYRFEAGAA
jgi:hypothetical protein